MRKLAIFLLLTCGASLAQLPLPNISYTSTLSGNCAATNGPCSNGLFLTGSNAYGTTGSAFNLGSGSTLDIAVAHYNAATITVSGTYANLTINFDFSDPTGGGGTNYFQEICARTDVNILEASEAVTANATRAWQCPVWAATRFRVRNSNAGLTGSPLVTIILTTAAIDPSLIVAASPPVVPGSTDPCQDLSQQKASVAVSAITAATQIVALSGTTVVYVCGYQLVASAGTNPSMQFEYGTGATCGTGTTVLTGAMATGVTVSTTAPGPILTAGNDVSLLKTAAGNALCLVASGTWSGFVTFVQQ